MDSREIFALVNNILIKDYWEMIRLISLHKDCPFLKAIFKYLFRKLVSVKIST